MKKLLKQLGLAEDATPEQIAEKAVAQLEVIEGLKGELKTALQANGELDKKIIELSAATGPKESKEFTKLVAEKMGAGLPRATAEEAARNQIASDAEEAKKAKKEKS